ncbi:MAG: TerB family tellurite resistance protein [Xanthomonadales bacterium]|nr:TerB family tellurite resistance protein [Xanthomonadales bacterium]
MHVVIGLLGSIISLLWVLHRLAEMGIDLGGLNPWLWRRRRNWRKKYEANPVYGLTSPMEATALLMTAVAKADGDMSAEEKAGILALFRNEFHRSDEEAASLLNSSTFLLGPGDEVRDNLQNVLSPSLERFTPEQAESAVELLQRVAEIGGGPSPSQRALVEAASGLLRPQRGPQPKWA